MKLKVGYDVKVLNHKLKKYIGEVGYICNIQHNKCFIGFWRYPDYIWNNLKSVKLYKISDNVKAMPKKNHKSRHKIRHGRRLNRKWSKIWFEEYFIKLKENK